jgi:hypothetical protein
MCPTLRECFGIDIETFDGRSQRLRTKTAIGGMATATLIAAMGVALATPAAAASLTETNFHNNPGNLRMHVYGSACMVR